MSQVEAIKQIQIWVQEIQEIRSDAEKQIEPFKKSIAALALENKIYAYIPSEVYGQGMRLITEETVEYYENDGYSVGDWISSDETC